VTTSITDRPADDAAEADAPRARRRRLLVLVLIVVAVLALAAALTWVVAFSSLLGVRTVQVRGTQLLNYAQVRAASGVVRGTPLVRLDTGDIAHRVERLRQVESARVETSFPSTVSIVVVERRPVGYVRTSGGADLVDRHGVHFRTVHAAPAALPRFVLPSGPQARSTGAALATVAAALPATLRKSVSSIQALDPTSITLVLSHGRIVRWGSADRSVDKARILPTLAKRNVERVDVTDPDQPFTR
jgi:cell division protein FtsQ